VFNIDINKVIQNVKPVWHTYLFIYLLTDVPTYLLTYLLHGAQAFLRS